MILKQPWCLLHKLLMKTQAFDFIAPLAIRLYLVPVFWMAGTNKLSNIEATANWFGNPEWGLGLPMPTLMAYLASITEVTGAVCLLLGLGVRYISLPLMVTMLMAIFFVHFDNGWLAIASREYESVARLNNFLAWLKETHPEHHTYITELGKPVILNNGVEFAVTYLIMLISLFFSGAGKYVSVDYWLSYFFPCKKGNKQQ